MGWGLGGTGTGPLSLGLPTSANQGPLLRVCCASQEKEMDKGYGQACHLRCVIDRNGLEGCPGQRL